MDKLEKDLRLDEVNVFSTWLEDTDDLPQGNKTEIAFYVINRVKSILSDCEEEITGELPKRDSEAIDKLYSLLSKKQPYTEREADLTNRSSEIPGRKIGVDIK